MKYSTVTIMFLMLLSISFGQTCAIKANPSRIINGNFENPSVSYYSFLSSIEGWASQDAIQVGKGYIYNSNWGSSQVVELDTNQNRPLSQNIEIDYDLTCLISFQYAARSGVALSSSHLRVYWNYNLVAELKPNDYQIKYGNFQVSGKKGTNSLIFMAAGSSDGLGATIDNVALRYKQADSGCSFDNQNFIQRIVTQCDAAVSSTNYDSLKNFYQESLKKALFDFLYENATNAEHVVNGGFQFPFFQQSYTFFSSIPGWNGAIQLGQGRVYNSQWPEDNIVAQLDVSGNTALTQTINISKEMTYTLTFKYAERSVLKNSSQMKVYWDGQLLADIVAVDPLVQVFTIDIDATIGTHQLKLEGTGNSDSYGITIDDVSLKAKQ